VTHVALESTGSYWQPVWNLLEDAFSLQLVNARHIKQVPGRKTDVRDAEWIATLLRHGLLRASFVPERPQRGAAGAGALSDLAGPRADG
jgi:transposase